MSKQDNLTDFLTDVADAIRAKKGTTDKINPQDFSDEIKNLPSGGAPTPCEFKDVNFYDYEGTILYSYDWDEFVAKNEMPPLPTHHEGLTCQEWNYTLEEVLEQGGRCDVGAIYIPSDGISKIVVDASIHRIVDLQINLTSQQSVKIDWGDGNTDTVATSANITHTYSADAMYTIRLEGKMSSLYIGKRKLALNVVGVHTTEDIDFVSMGTTSCKGITVAGGYQGGLCNRLLAHFNFSRKNTQLTANTFNGNDSVKSISIPCTCTKVTGLFDSKGFRHMCIPKSVTHLDISTVRAIFVLESFHVDNATYYMENNCVIEMSTKTVMFAMATGASIPEGVLIIAPYSFLNSYIYDIRIPDSVVTIKDNAFYAQQKSSQTYDVVYMGRSVASIEANAFGYTRVMGCYDFRNYEHIPNLVNANAFASMQTTCKIIVPDNLYDEWIAATNWSSLASRIVKASEYVEPTN